MANRANYQFLLDRLLKEYSQEELQCDFSYWFDPRPHGGLRLSAQAYALLDQCEITKYVFEIDPAVIRRPKILLDLDRKITCPYFIQPKKPCQLILFESATAVMVTLYGDIEKFLQNLRSQ